MKFLLKQFGVSLVMVLCATSVVAYADDYVPADEEQNFSMSYTLDGNNQANEGDTIDLKFGETLNEALSWVVDDSAFLLTDDLIVQGDLSMSSTVLTFDVGNTGGAGNTIRIIAEQGNDGDGEIRYNPSTDQWEYSNDGGAFSAFGSGSGGGVNFASATNTSFGNGAEMVVAHAADSDYKRHVQVKERVTDTSATDTSLDFDNADEGNYVQEDAANGTDFLADKLTLHGTFSGTGTTNVAENETATASSTSAPASSGNDNNDSTFWYTAANASNGGWWQVDLGEVKVINQAKIRWYNASGTYNCTSFNIQGTNTDGSNYVTVWTGDTSDDPQEATYDFSSPAMYRYWRFECATAQNSSYYVVREFRLYEALATYPTDPKYVTTSGTNSLSTASWTGVTDATMGETLPSNTSAKYLVSFDGRATWKYWTGSAWAASSLANLQSQGMSKATIEAISSGQWMGTGGINSDASQSLDFAVDLDTNDANKTPVLDYISVTYTTPEYWKVMDSGYSVRHFSPTQTTVVNQSGGTKNVIVTVVLP